MGLLPARRRRAPVRGRSDLQDQGHLQLIESVANPLQRVAHSLNAIDAAADPDLIDAEATQPERALPIGVSLHRARRAQRYGELALGPVARNKYALPEHGAEWSLRVAHVVPFT